MSSAANHRARSHRSYSGKRSTMNKIQSKATYRRATVQRTLSLREYFAAFRKHRESKADKA